MKPTVSLQLECMGRINGKLLTVSGSGQGVVEAGQFALALLFKNLPPGYPIATSALWTCCSTPSFAIEHNGACNMLSLSGGRYKCARRFDFGKYGAYDYNYELRLSDDSADMKATGLIEGDLSLPDMDFVESSFSEMMIPVSRGEIQSFVRARFITPAGEIIPVQATGRYTPIDGRSEWACPGAKLDHQRPQVRTSFIEHLQKGSDSLELRYGTVVKGIDTPAIPKDEFDRLRQRVA